MARDQTVPSRNILRYQLFKLPHALITTDKNVNIFCESRSPAEAAGQASDQRVTNGMRIKRADQFMQPRPDAVRQF
jgi:hypothetical protein